MPCLLSLLVRFSHSSTKLGSMIKTYICILSWAGEEEEMTKVQYHPCDIILLADLYQQ